MKTFIVAHTAKNREGNISELDQYTPFFEGSADRNEADARADYHEKVNDPHTFTATLAMIIESTDYLTSIVDNVHPIPVTGKIKDIVIRPCRREDGEDHIIECPEADAEFYSLYIHYADREEGNRNAGLRMCFADCSTKAQAKALVQFIKSICKNYTPE